MSSVYEQMAKLNDAVKNGNYILIDWDGYSETPESIEDVFRPYNPKEKFEVVYEFDEGYNNENY